MYRLAKRRAGRSIKAGGAAMWAVVLSSMGACLLGICSPTEYYGTTRCMVCFLVAFFVNDGWSLSTGRRCTEFCRLVKIGQSFVVTSLLHDFCSAATLALIVNRILNGSGYSRTICTFSCAFRSLLMKRELNLWMYQQSNLQRTCMDVVTDSRIFPDYMH